MRQTDDIAGEDRWLWLKQGNLKRETESLILAAQEQAIRTNVIKAKIDNTQEQSKCRMCGEKDETVNHLISECSKMAQREYKRRHDWVGRRVHWDQWRRGRGPGGPWPPLNGSASKEEGVPKLLVCII